ncbi:MAG: glycosyltransferase family 9 protein [Candidatus Omnitrophica bacterium]|nr:glycosyltransferase family 9 protein [Candidatus Omnitrophota bacterium]
MSKVLIIKLGYSETLDPEISATTNLGDVLRTTVLLNFFKNKHLTWLVDEKAYPLLEANPYIQRLLIYNLETVLQLQKEHFDTVINLEKVPGICAFADSINAWRRFGFRFDETLGQAQSYDGAEKVLSLCRNLNKKRVSKKYWQEALIEMIGKKWNKERYVLGCKPKTKVKFDVGFNWTTSHKWKNKSWPKEHWKKLEKLLKGRYSSSWQKGLNNLYEYIDWINSCKLIVTNDSLGMHIAIALRKKIIAFFGPTSANEIYLYDKGQIFVPKVSYKCLPCLKRECFQKKHCMYFIEPNEVLEAIKNLLE